MGLARGGSVAAVGLLSVWGCGAGSELVSEATVVDSAGVRIVSHPLESQPDRWSADRALELQSELEVPLFELGVALRLTDGGYAVADAGNHRVVLFGAAGEFRSTTGQSGEGPGEFQHLTLLARGVADSLVVWDRQARRVSVLTPSGEFAHSFSLETTEDVPFASVVGVFGDGSFLATGFVDTGGQPPANGRQTYSSPSYHFSSSGQFQSVSGSYATTETYYQVTDRGFSVFPVLFGAESFRLPTGGRFVTATSDTYEFRYREPDGTTSMIMRREPSGRPITAEARSARTDALVEEARPGQADRVEAVLREMETPDYLPEFSDVFADRLGRVWVKEFEVAEPDFADWRVFGSDGMAVASVSLPARFRPTDAGEDFVLGVSTDELDVETVVRYTLAR